jgi:hypothetical protein
MATAAKNLVGKKVKVISNKQGNHGFEIGEKIIIVAKINGCGATKMWLAKSVDGGTQQYNIYEREFRLFTNSKEDLLKEIEELKKKQKEIDEEINQFQEYVAFLDENSLIDFNETEFKTYKVLKTINEKTSDLEKAKIIAKILDSK